MDTLHTEIADARYIRTAQAVSKRFDQLKPRTVEGHHTARHHTVGVPFDGAQFQLVQALGHYLGRVNMHGHRTAVWCRS